MQASQCANITGHNIHVPGDKSISHRALMLSSIANGKTDIHGLLEGEDVISTANALRAMGAKINKSDAVWHVEGAGPKNLSIPDNPLDMGNSGTSTRLLMGLVAGLDIRAAFTGDASLSNRPMGRVIAPLQDIGAAFEPLGPEKDKLPLRVTGTASPHAMTYTLPVASAQVKSAILLASLNASGTVTVIEPHPTRDHTENMLRHFSVAITNDKSKDGHVTIVMNAPALLNTNGPIHVPGDISSAAFPIVAALITPNSELTLRNVGINPLRTGVLDSLKGMGADITLQNQSLQGGEPIADINVKTSPLHGTTIPAERAPRMIDEYPALAMAAAYAKGTTRMEGVGELRVKESDRLAMVEAGLNACGVTTRSGKDWLEIDGQGVPPQGGALVKTALDHRIAMSFLVLGCASEQPVHIDDPTPIQTSFPNFVDLMNTIGCNISP